MSRPRRKAEPPEEFHVDERWAVSYADMVTVLMCLFIVLFAMSTVDQAKFEQLRNSLATGFGQVEVGSIDTAEGVVVPAELVNQDLEGLTDLELAAQEVDDLREIQRRIDEGLRENELQESVRFELDERGLTIRLVSSETFFLPDRAELTERTGQVLDSIGPVLASIDRGVSVEGHTAKLPETFLAPRDWELSTERSVNVLRHLVEKGGVPGPSIAAVGYGETRPLAPGVSEEELKLNRRVDIVVLSDESEAVRELIPEVAAGT